MKKIRWIVILIGIIAIVFFVQMRKQNYESIGWPGTVVEEDTGISQVVRVENEVYLFSYEYGTQNCSYTLLTGAERDAALDSFQVSAMDERIAGNFHMMCGQKAILETLLWGLPILAVLVALCGGLTNKSVVVRIFCFSEIIVLLICVALGIAIIENTKSYIDDIEVDAMYSSLRYVYSDMNKDGDVTEEALEYHLKNTEELFATIVIVEKDADGEVAITDASGRAYSGYLMSEQGLELQAFVKDVFAKQTSGWRYLPCGGYHTMVVATYSYAYPNHSIVGIVNGETYIQASRKEIVTDLIILVIGFAVFSLILQGAYLIYYARWKKLINAVEAVVIDRKEIVVPSRNIGGMSQLWHAFREMYEALEDLRYGMGQSIKTALMFMPAGLERLVGKKNVSEICVGDFRLAEGTMLRCSMESMKAMSVEAYEQFAEKYFAMIQELQTEDGAIHINCDSDFGNNKLFFVDADMALKYAVDAAHACDEEVELRGKRRLFFLNSSQYSCGISGTPRRAVPFAYCKEDDVIDMYEGELLRAGVQIILTENTLQRVNQAEHMIRYIGYIVKPNTGEQTKLYECQDVFTENKKRILRATKDKFEEALALFYSNDFYLARNTFNEVLQMNPADQIARWYLFSCEYYLNSDSAEEALHGLYENTILTLKYKG